MYIMEKKEEEEIDRSYLFLFYIDDDCITIFPADTSPGTIK